MRIFLFILCLFSFLFFICFVWFESLMLLFFPYGHSEQTRSLLLLDLYYSAWRAICDSYHRFIAFLLLLSTARESFHVM